MIPHHLKEQFHSSFLIHFKVIVASCLLIILFFTPWLTANFWFSSGMTVSGWKILYNSYSSNGIQLAKEIYFVSLVLILSLSLIVQCLRNEKRLIILHEMVLGLVAIYVGLFYLNEFEDLVHLNFGLIGTFFMGVFMIANSILDIFSKNKEQNKDKNIFKALSEIGITIVSIVFAFFILYILYQKIIS